jgi:hypothetical protein
MAMNTLKTRAVMSHILSGNGSGPQSNVLQRGSNIQYIAITACLPSRGVRELHGDPPLYTLPGYNWHLD